MSCRRIMIIWIGILLLASSAGSVTSEQTRKVVEIARGIARVIHLLADRMRMQCGSVSTRSGLPQAVSSIFVIRTLLP